MMQKSIYVLVINLSIALFTNAQNVGIGVLTPTEKLHVAGNIKSDTLKPNVIKIAANAGEGKLLTSDAEGNGSWQAPAASSTVTATGTVGFGSWGDCSTNSISEYDPVTDTAAVAGDALGFSTAMSGNFAIVGASGGLQGKGYANIYQFNGSTWVFMQRLIDSGSNTAFESFGISVAISDNFAIVGAQFDAIGANASQGSACIFQYNGTSWVLSQKITDPGGAANDFFGRSVSISGNNAIVGSIGDDIGTQTDQGSACIFHFNGASWVFAQKLIDPAGFTSDIFGSVSISGNSAIVGSQGTDIGTSANVGAASIFQFNGSNWAFVKRITDPTGLANDAFGGSTSISGNFAVVGAIAADGPNSADQGAALVFRFDGANWVFMQKLTDIAGGLVATLGNSVSISDDYIIVGDQIRDSNGGGTALIFLREGLEWQLLQKIIDPHGHNGNRFGTGVSIDAPSRRFLVGAAQYAGGSGKAVFGKF